MEPPAHTIPGKGGQWGLGGRQGEGTGLDELEDQQQKLDATLSTRQLVEVWLWPGAEEGCG